MPYCHECGCEVGERDRFCPACGADLDQAPGTQRDSGPQGDGRDSSDDSWSSGDKPYPEQGEQGPPQRTTSESGRRRDQRRGRRSGRGQRRRTGRGDPGRQSDRDDRGQQSDWDSQGRQSDWDSQGRQSRWNDGTRQSGGPGQSAHGRWDQQPQQTANRRRSRTGEKGLLSFSLSYPSSGGAGTIFLGGAVLFFFWLVIPVFLAIGYFVRLAAAAAGDRPSAPGFGEWAGMVKDGFVLVFASLPIWLVYGILIGITQEVSLALYVVVALLGSYLFPAIFVNFAVERTWRAIYDVSTFAELLLTKGYAIGFLVYTLVINGIGAFVLLILLIVTLLTVVGIVLWPVIFFYLYCINAALWGRVYRQVMGPAEIPDPPAHEPQPQSHQRQPRQQRQSRQY